VPAWSEGAIGCIVADPARIVIDAEEAERLWAAVERLPAKQRAIVLLRFRDGLTLAEAGRALGLSRTRVHELERLALSRLRCVMEHAPDRGLERSGCPR
jgi:RNA polymerase sigma factor (sigma-70 family)